MIKINDELLMRIVEKDIEVKLEELKFLKKENAILKISNVINNDFSFSGYYEDYIKERNNIDGQEFVEWRGVYALGNKYVQLAREFGFELVDETIGEHLKSTKQMLDEQEREDLDNE